jgi:hypothetical protein
LIAFINAWTEAEGKKDQEILSVAVNQHPRWPWSTTEGFDARLAEANERPALREGMTRAAHPKVR